MTAVLPLFLRLFNASSVTRIRGRTVAPNRGRTPLPRGTLQDLWDKSGVDVYGVSYRASPSGCNVNGEQEPTSTPGRNQLQKDGRRGRNRTCDPLLRRQMLYPLSYTPTCVIIAAAAIRSRIEISTGAAFRITHARCRASKEKCSQRQPVPALLLKVWRVPGGECSVAASPCSPSRSRVNVR